MPTFNDGDLAPGIRTKINNAILRAERTMVLDDVTQLATLVYDLNSQWGVATGMQVYTVKEGFSYDVLDSAASTFDIQPGAVKLDVLPSSDGSYNFRAMLPAANGSTDDYPLLEKLITEAAYRNSADTRYGTVLSIYFPRGNYFMGSTLDLKRTVKLWGDAGFPSGDYARLTFAANTTGIIINRFNTFNGTVESPTTTGADGTTIQGISIMSQGGTDTTKAGVFFKARGSLRSVEVRGFAGNGIQVIANCGSLDGTEGNANCFYIENCSSIGNRRHGFYADGDCANAGIIVNLDCNSNGRCGIYDSSFLGNTYIGCHTATNGLANVGGNSSSQSSVVRYGGRQYMSHWNASEAQLVVTEPGTNANVWVDIGAEYVSSSYPLWQTSQPEGTYFRGFAYFSDNLNAANVFLGCYNEADGNCVFLGPTTVYGGLMINIRNGDRIGANGQGQYSMKSMSFSNGGHTTTATDGTGWLTLSHGSDGFPWRLKRDTNGDILLDHANLGARQVFRVKGESASRPFKFAVNDFLLGDRMMAMGAAAPTTGTWVRGDYVRNINSAVGQPKGWFCTVGGTPGTWVSEGDL